RCSGLRITDRRCPAYICADPVRIRAEASPVHRATTPHAKSCAISKGAVPGAGVAKSKGDACDPRAQPGKKSRASREISRSGADQVRAFFFQDWPVPGQVA